MNIDFRAIPSLFKEKNLRKTRLKAKKANEFAILIEWKNGATQSIRAR